MTSTQQVVSPISAATTRADNISRRTATAMMAALSYWLVPVLGLAYVAFTSYGALTEQRYYKANGFTGELLSGHTAGQSFVARYNNLSAVQLRLGTYGPQALAGVTLHLKTGPAQPDIAAVTVPATEIRGENPWQTFSFPPISDSQNRLYYLEVESPQGKPYQAITLFQWKPVTAGDPYPYGTAYENSKPQQADLAFSLRYSPSPLEAWAQAARAAPAGTSRIIALLSCIWLVFISALFARKMWKQRQTQEGTEWLAKPQVLAGLLSVALAQGLLYLMLVPLWQGPDEFSHFAYAALLEKHNLDNGIVQKLDWPNKDRDQNLIDTITQSLNKYNFTRYEAGSPAPGAPYSPGISIYSELRQPAPYYWLCAAAMRAASINPYANPETALLLMRLVTVVLSLGVVALAWLAGKMLASSNGLGAWLPLLLPLTIILLPMHAFTSSIANNDVMGELAVSALVVAVIALLRQSRGVRGIALAAAIVALAFLASGAKSSALSAALPLALLGLAAWVCQLCAPLIAFRLPRIRGVVTGAIALSIIGVIALAASPLLFTPLQTASGWKLNGKPVDKAPQTYSETALDGQYVLSLEKGSLAAQRIEIAVPHQETEFSLSGYARLKSPASQGAAVIEIAARNRGNARSETQLDPNGGWTLVGASYKLLPDVSRVNINLIARSADVEFDDFTLSGGGVASLLNPSFEREEVGLRGSLAHILPQEVQWMAQVAANPQPFNKQELWSYYANEQFKSFWGNFGWVALPLPGGWFLFWLALSFLAITGLLVKMVASDEPWDWRDWLLVVSILALGAAVCIGFMRQAMVRSAFGVEAFPQGRYLFVLSIPLAWMLLSGLAEWKRIAYCVLRIKSLRNTQYAIRNTQWGAWAWAGLLASFAAFALAALIVPYYYG